jgi:Heat induced stress protein YflT
MAVYGHVVVGIFDNRGLADDAVDGLQNAGFSPDQIYYSGHGEHHDSDWWQGITKLFSRDRRHDDVDNELKSLGIPDDKIHYYEGKYDNGRTIVAVNAAGREEEALAILRENGAHD